MSKYYLYRHIRLDKNEPFYIGIGTKPPIYKNNGTEFSRAYSKCHRSSFWKKIVNKTNYRVEILLESDNNTYIKEKEKEFIILYGRIKHKNGTLVNITEGGEGTVGYTHSLETIRKIKLGRQKMDYSNIGIKVYQYDLQGNFVKEWANTISAATYIGIHKSYLSRLIKYSLNGNFCRGYYWYSTKLITVQTNAYNNRINNVFIN